MEVHPLHVPFSGHALVHGAQGLLLQPASNSVVNFPEGVKPR